MADDVTSTLSVRIETGNAARDLLALQQGLEGAAGGVARLGREIQNHSGNIQKVLGELSKHGFGGLSQALSNETKRVGAGMRQLELEVEAAAGRTGLKAGKKLAEGLQDGAEQGSAAIHQIMLRSAEMTGKLQLDMAAKDAKQMQAFRAGITNQKIAEIGTEEAKIRAFREGITGQKLAQIAEDEAKQRAFREGITGQKLTEIASEEAKIRAFREGITGQKLAQIAEDEAKQRAFREGITGQKLTEIASEEAKIRAFREGITGQKLAQIAEDEAKQRAFREGISAQRLAQIASDESKQKAFREGILSQKLAEIDREERAIAARRAKYVGRTGTLGGYATALNTLPISATRDSIGATQALDQQRASALGLQDATDRSRQAMKRWSGEARIIHDTARGAAAGIGYLWMTWGNIGAMAAGFAGIHAVSSGIKELAGIEKELTFAAQAGGGTVDNLSQRIMAMYGNGNKMLFTARQMAEALKNLTLAGFSTDEAFQMLNSTYKFAAAGELDLAVAAQGVQQTMNSFSLPVSETGRVTDVLAKAAAASAVTISDMVEAMKSGSVVGGLYGVTIEDFAKSAALLGKVGIVGSSAGTAIKNFYAELSSPKSVAAKKITQELGLSFYQMQDGIVKLKPLGGIIDELRTKFRGLSETNQQAFFSKVQDIFNERGIKEAAQAIKMTDAEYAKFNDTLSASAGYVDSLYGKLSQTTQGIYKDIGTQGLAAITGSLKEAEPSIKALGESLKTLVTSSGFKEFLTTSIHLITTLTQFMVDHGRTILAVAATYAAFKVARGAVDLLVSGMGGILKGAEFLLLMGTRARALTTEIRALRAESVGLAAVQTGLAATATRVSGLGAIVGLLGSPIGLVVGLLTAGITLWALWGDSAETAMQKAKRASDDTAKSVDEFIARLDRQRQSASLGIRGEDITTTLDLLKKEKQAIVDLDTVYGKGNNSSDRKDAYDAHMARISKLSAEYQQLTAESAAAAATNSPATSVAPNYPDKTAAAEALRLGKATLEGQISLAKEGSQVIQDLLKHQYDMRLLSETEYNDKVYEAKQAALLKEYHLYVDQYNKLSKLGKKPEAQAALNKVETASAAMGKNSLDYSQSTDLIRKREQDTVDAQMREFTKSNRATDFNRSMKGVDEWLRPVYAEQENAIAALNSQIEGAKRSGQEYSEKTQEALWANMRNYLGGLWSRANEVTPERITAMLTQYNDLKAAKSQELDAQSSIGTISKAAAQAQLKSFLVDSGKGLKDLAGTNLNALIEGLGLSAAAAAKLKGEFATALAEIDNAGKTSWLDGLTAGVKSYSDSIGDLYSGMKQMSENAFKSMGTALDNYVETGKFSFKDLTNSMIKDMLRIAMQQAVTKPLADAAGSALSAAGSIVLSMLATGGAFGSSSTLSAHRNSVVSQPTTFAFAKGVGLMGEKPGSPGEAIMPLTRMSGGDLGVKVDGTGGASSVAVSITVNDNRTQTETKDTSGNDQTGPKLAELVKGVVHTTLLKEMRPGGLLA